MGIGAGLLAGRYFPRGADDPDARAAAMPNSEAHGLPQVAQVEIDVHAVERRRSLVVATLVR
jgi:hypothetical protein